jgi:hypothetical protein
MLNKGECRSCGAAIIWAETASGKRMPVDVEPHADGTIMLIDERSGFIPRADIVRRGTPGNLLRRSHFATCPNAATHRKPSPRGAA